MSAGTIRRGLSVQRSVIGALLMRELHTRYGRDNVGYLWLFLEPALLAVAVVLIHAGAHDEIGLSVEPVPFAILGYTAFIMFRSIFTRAESVIEANAPLLYHRQVTLFDMLFARALLELAGIVVVLVVLLAIAALTGLGAPPARPLMLIAGVGLLWWWSFALSLLICAGTNNNRLLTKFVHPVSYILLPLSGAFYMLEWLPQPWRDIMAKFPMTQMFELIRHGHFAAADARYVEPVYLLFWCLGLSFLGLLSLRAVRSHIHIG